MGAGAVYLFVSLEREMVKVKQVCRVMVVWQMNFVDWEIEVLNLGWTWTLTDSRCIEIQVSHMDGIDSSCIQFIV